MNENTELKTIGYTPFNYSADRALFRVNGGVSIQEALERASDLLHLAHRLAEDAAFEKSNRPLRLGCAFFVGDEQGGD